MFYYVHVHTVKASQASAGSEQKARAAGRKHALMPSRGEMAGQVGRRMIAIAPQSHHRACPTHANHRSRATSTRLALHTFLTRMRTPQDWGANVVFSSRPTSARPQSARGPGGAPAGPGPSMSKVAGKTNQQLEDETEELKRKHRLAPRSGVPSAPCAMPSSHPPNVRPPQIKRSALTSRRRSCRRATQRACRKRI